MYDEVDEYGDEGAIPGERGCGVRKADGIYAECGLSPFGRPVEAFLFDPPLPVPEGLSVNPLGVTFVQADQMVNGRLVSTVHIVDWVGADHYPNVADFIEEVRVLGVSRRLSSSLDYSLLTKESRLLLVHSRAYIANHTEYQQVGPCPRNNDHADGSPCCGLWWEDVRDGEPSGEGREVIRKLPSAAYRALSTPDNVQPDYRPGFIASFPISRLVVVAGERTAEQLQKIQKAALPTAVVEA